MKEYIIVPEARYSKLYPLLAVAYLIAAIAFGLFGHFVTAVGHILAYIILFCSLYYGGLFLYYKNYQVNVSSNSLTVCNIFNKQKKYNVNTLQWKLLRIPWYNSYFLLLYSTAQIPIALIKPHWKNASKILSLPHFGKLSSVEIKYIKFMKKVGLL